MTLSVLGEEVAAAWQSFERAAVLGARVAPAVPILFFGDVGAYLVSPLRVVTVGLNPSRSEFPRDEPFRRFPLAEAAGRGDPGRYLDALSAYFRTDPYRQWFGHFEALLNGMGASYYDGGACTVLHTDICSPVATDPTWSRLGDADRKALAADGVGLWHELLKALRPHVVVLSVAERHLGRIEFDALGAWELVHRIERTGDGALRGRPYEASGCWFDVGGEPSLFVHCPASQTPLGPISKSQRHQLGAILSETHRNVDIPQFHHPQHPKRWTHPDERLLTEH